ncbi:hypothetical protein [Microcoleus sp. F4-D5]|uniref:hypothetical protein n=1 Tax=Microcoleus sp. F4-D5 TaxID=2818760 RepID=UPI002FD58022
MRPAQGSHPHICVKISCRAIAIWDSLRVGMINADRVTNFGKQPDTCDFLETALIARHKTDTVLEIAAAERAIALEASP